MPATGRPAAPGPAGVTPHGIPLSDRSTVGETFGVTSLDQITASRQRSRLRSCGLSCHPDCCVMGPTLPRDGFKASQSRRLGSASDPGNHWAAIPAVLLGLDCGDKTLVHVLDGATGESWHQRYDGSCAPPGRPPLRRRRGARRPRSAARHPIAPPPVLRAAAEGDPCSGRSARAGQARDRVSRREAGPGPTPRRRRPLPSWRARRRRRGRLGRTSCRGRGG